MSFMKNSYHKEKDTVNTSDVCLLISATNQRSPWFSFRYVVIAASWLDPLCQWFLTYMGWDHRLYNKMDDMTAPIKVKPKCFGTTAVCYLPEAVHHLVNVTDVQLVSHCLYLVLSGGPDWAAGAGSEGEEVTWRDLIHDEKHWITSVKSF